MFLIITRLLQYFYIILYISILFAFLLVRRMDMALSYGYYNEMDSELRIG